MKMIIRSCSPQMYYSVCSLFTWNRTGWQVCITIMHGSKDGNINQYLADTIGQVFQTEYTVDVTGSTNRELFASDNEDILDILASNTEQLNNNELQAMMSKVAAESSRYVKGDYVLTDDQALVKLLGMQVIDELIKDEVAYYKDIYEKDGISGVLEVF